MYDKKGNRAFNPFYHMMEEIERLTLGLEIPFLIFPGNRDAASTVQQAETQDDEPVNDGDVDPHGAGNVTGPQHHT